MDGPAAMTPLTLTSIDVAIQAMIKSGAMAAHESQTGECAILCLFQEKRSRGANPDSNIMRAPGWSVQTCDKYYLQIIENSDPSLVEEFCKHPKACLLLGEAAVCKRDELVRFLLSRGVSVALGEIYPERSSTPLEHFIKMCSYLHGLDELLEHTTPEQLNIRQKEIFSSLIFDRRHHDHLKILKKLVKAGMRFDHFEDGKESNLVISLRRERIWLVRPLLDMGVSPYQGKLGHNALMAAVEFGNTALLSKFIKNSPADFDWDSRYTLVKDFHSYRYNALRNRQGHNIFHAMAAACIGRFPYETASVVVKELKESRENLRSLINATTHDECQRTPIHYILTDFDERPCLREDALKLLEILIENGADLTIPARGLLNGTLPLHLPIKIRDSRIAKLLFDAEPRVAMMKDDNGLNPLDLAAWYQYQDLLPYFESKLSLAGTRVLTEKTS